jgi:hypothetical protein
MVQKLDDIGYPIFLRPTAVLADVSGCVTTVTHPRDASVVELDFGTIHGEILLDVGLQHKLCLKNICLQPCTWIRFGSLGP